MVGPVLEHNDWAGAWREGKPLVFGHVFITFEIMNLSLLVPSSLHYSRNMLSNDAQQFKYSVCVERIYEIERNSQRLKIH